MHIRKLRESLGKKIRSFTASKLAGDFQHLIVRQLGIKCVSFFATSYAMRKLGPDALGATGLPMAVVGLLTLGTNLGYDTVLPKYIARAGEDEERRRVAGRYLSLRFLLALLCLPVMLAGALWTGLGAKPSHGSLEASLWIWGAASMVLLGTNLGPQGVAQGLDRLREFGNAQFLSSMAMAALFVGLLTLWPTPQAFLLVQAIGLILLSAFVLFRGETRISLRPKVALLGMLPGHVREAWPMMLNVFVIFGLYTSDASFLAFLSSHYEIGLYSSAITLCNAVNAFIALIPTVFYPRMIAWHKESERKMIRRAVLAGGGMLAVTPVIYLVALFGAGFVLPVLLGKQFGGAVSVFAALVSCFVVGVAYSIICSGLVLLGRERLILGISAGGALAGAIFYPLASLFGAVQLAHAKLAIVAMVCLIAAAISLFIEKKSSR